MADYYPLIAKAVAGVEKNTAESRRALYERARTALLAQLRGTNPPLSESDITRERLGLEEAIRKVEAEAVRQARVDVTRSPSSAARAPSPPAARPSPPRAPLPYAEAKPAAPAGPPPEKLPPAPQVETARPPRPLRESGPAATPAVGPPEPRNAEVRLEPRMMPPRTEPRMPGSEAPALRGVAPPPPSRDVDEAMDLDTAPPPPPSRRGPPQPPRRDLDNGMAGMRPRRSLTGIAIVVVLLLAVVGAGAAVWWQLPNIVALTSRTPPPPAVKEAQVPTRPKIDDRLVPGGDLTRSQQTAQGAAVAQRVVLYEEDPADPQGKRVVGSAIWRTETVSPGAGQPPDVVVKADIEVPERKMAMTFSFRRNTDQALPASHTAEVIFKLPADFPSGGVGNVPGILMKQSEQARGVPLAGVAVKVTNNYFLIALYSVDAEKERNIKLIKERAWFDVPIVYTNNRRAILAMEKGTPGERAFEEAFKAWGQ